VEKDNSYVIYFKSEPCIHIYVLIKLNSYCQKGVKSFINFWHFAIHRKILVNFSHRGIVRGILKNNWQENHKSMYVGSMMASMPTCTVRNWITIGAV